MAMNLATTMDSIATALATVTGLRCYGWPDFSATVPCGLVGYPDEIDYDVTYQSSPGVSSHDNATFKVWVVVGSQVTRTARDDLSTYVSSAGAKTIKTAIETGLGGGCQVHKCKIVNISMGGKDFLAGEFEVEVTV